MSNSTVPTIRTSFLTYVASKAAAVSLPQVFDTPADGAAESYLQSSFQNSVGFGQRLDELTKGQDASAKPSPEFEASMAQIEKDFQSQSALHAKASDLTSDVLRSVQRELGEVFPTSMEIGPDGIFAIQLSRLPTPDNSATIIPDRGFIQEQRGTLFIDTTPGADGVLACYESKLPQARPEFEQLAQGNPIRTFDLNPNHPAKQELAPLVTRLVDLSNQMQRAEKTGDTAAKTKLEETSKGLEATLETYQKFMGFLAEDANGTPTSAEDKGNGVLVIQLVRDEEKAGQILLDTRPGLPGVQVATIQPK